MLAANELGEADVETDVVGFEQLDAVCNGRVDAAVGYAANEPVRTCGEDEEMQVLEIADVFNVVSNILTNYVNHIAGTEVDFPAVPDLETAVV